MTLFFFKKMRRIVWTMCNIIPPLRPNFFLETWNIIFVYKKVARHWLVSLNCAFAKEKKNTENGYQSHIWFCEENQLTQHCIGEYNILYVTDNDTMMKSVCDIASINFFEYNISWTINLKLVCPYFLLSVSNFWLILFHIVNL